MLPAIESKGQSHQRGPVFAVGDAVKTAHLDEEPHVLEVEMVPNFVKKIIRPSEVAVVGTLMNNEVPPALVQYL